MASLPEPVPSRQRFALPTSTRPGRGYSARPQVGLVGVERDDLGAEEFAGLCHRGEQHARGHVDATISVNPDLVGAGDGPPVHPAEFAQLDVTLGQLRRDTGKY